MTFKISGSSNNPNIVYIQYQRNRKVHITFVPGSLVVDFSSISKVVAEKFPT